MAEVSYLNHTNQDTAQPSAGESSSVIWLVLFMGIISLSLLVNTSCLVGVAGGRKRNKMFFFLLLFFIINLVEYILLVFEFSLGPTSHYPYSEQSCTFYQVLLQFLPLLSPWCLVLFVCHAYSAVHIPPPRFSPSAFLLISLMLLLSIPSFLYSGLAVYPSGARYCVMDLAGVASWAGMPMERQQMATALYYLMYKPILTYLIPISLVTPMMVKMGKLVNTPMDDQLNITLTMAITISYGVFHLPHAATVFIR